MRPQLGLARAGRLSAPGKFRVGSKPLRERCSLQRLVRDFSHQDFNLSFFIGDVAHGSAAPRDSGDFRASANTRTLTERQMMPQLYESPAFENTLPPTLAVEKAFRTVLMPIRCFAQWQS